MKNAIRKEIRSRKRSYSATQLAEKSNVIAAQLEQHPLFVAAQRVMLYAALPDEVQTQELITKWKREKLIILPTIVGDDIIPVAIEKDTPLQEGAYHILEPQNSAYEGDFDLIVVPGMAFDAEGHRLGRGKGYYDRFLAKHPNTPTIGICFDFQQWDKIPCEPHDQRIDVVISDAVHKEPSLQE